MYANISQGLQENIELIAFFILKGIISILIINNPILITMTIMPMATMSSISTNRRVKPIGVIMPLPMEATQNIFGVP